MKKFILDLKVSSVEALSPKHVLIKLTDEKPLPDMLPGQFVEVRVDDSPTTFLRRPISINFVDRTNNELWLLVAAIGGLMLLFSDNEYFWLSWAIGGISCGIVAAIVELAIKE